ncbi:hypothetical protein JCM10207_004475 [Rhodosporidiobolus poonsookiae]
MPKKNKHRKKPVGPTAPPRPSHDFPPTPPDSLTTSPTSSRPVDDVKSQQPSQPSYQPSVELALQHLTNGFPGRAYEALAPLLPATRPAASRSAGTIDLLAWHVGSAKNSIQKQYWPSTLEHLDSAEKLWGEGEKPWEGTKWRLQALEGTKKWKEMERVVEGAFPLHPVHAQTLLYYRALGLYHGAKLDEALEYGEKAQKARRDPDFQAEKARTLVDRIRLTLKYKQFGKQAFEAGQYKQAVKEYTSAMGIDSANQTLRAILLNNRALAHFKAGDFRSALTDSNSCLFLAPFYVKALHTRSKTKEALGDLSGALNSLQTACALSPAGSGERRALEEEKEKLQERKEEKERKEREEREERRREAEEQRKREYAEKHPDHYATLGVPRTATQDEIRAAYKRQALKHHPDKGGDEKEFQKVAAAHEVLSNERKRARFDAGEESDEEGGIPFPFPFFFYDYLFAGARARRAAADED